MKRNKKVLLCKVFICIGMLIVLPFTSGIARTYWTIITLSLYIVVDLIFFIASMRKK
ncbi:MAG: hypothetical protein K0S04_2530 [Herbinix sp.]|jgi:hypothetical protein|nr:hypothetical protein [Herbinix sp.]